VTVDFPVHLIAHHTHGRPGSSAASTLRAVWPALRLGAGTTLAGLFAFGLADLPGIREMALFTFAGVAGALSVTRFALPHFLGPAGQRTRVAERLAGACARAAQQLTQRRALSAAVLLGAALLCVSGLPAMRFSDDLTAWLPASNALRAEDARVQAQLGGGDVGRMVIATGATERAALAVNGRISAALADAQRAGEIDGYRSLHALLWPEELQARNARALRAVPELEARLTQALDAAGFETAAFAAFFAAAKADVPPLTLSALLASPLRPVAESFVLDLGGTRAFTTFLRGVRRPAALERRLASVDGAIYLDQHAFLGTLYGRFRASVLWLISLGLLAVVGMVVIRHRSLRTALAAVLPAALAACGALAALALLGVTLDLFHVIGLLLVLSMGEDYGVFLVETRGEAGLPATMLGLVLSCASTVLSFGLLAMSAIPALSSLGQVISLGMVFSLLWAPAGLVLLPARREGAGG